MELVFVVAQALVVFIHAFGDHDDVVLVPVMVMGYVVFAFPEVSVDFVELVSVCARDASVELAEQLVKEQVDAYVSGVLEEQVFAQI